MPERTAVHPQGSVAARHCTVVQGVNLNLEPVVLPQPSVLTLLVEA